MPELVHRHRKQVICATDIKRLTGIKSDIAGDRVVIHRRRAESLGQRAIPEVVAADPDVAHRGIALLIISGTAGGAAVGDDTEIDVRLLGPNLGCLQNLILPGRSRAEFAVERGKKIARDSPQVCSIPHETDGDKLGTWPHIAGYGIRDKARFQFLKPQGRPWGPGGKARRSPDPFA